MLTWLENDKVSLRESGLNTLEAATISLEDPQTRKLVLPVQDMLPAQDVERIIGINHVRLAWEFAITMDY